MYKRTTTDNIQRISDGAFIPADPGNADYVVYLAWVDEGNTPAAAEVPSAAEIWEKIKARREHLSDTGGYKVVIGGVDMWFHSDAKSKVQQLGLLRQADRIEAAGGNMDAPFPGPGPGGVLPWKTMDGNYVVMTAAIAQAVFGAAEAQDKAIYATAEAHRAAMLAAPDHAAYDFSGGWPAVYTPA